MSLKPLKQSDLNKSWMRPRPDRAIKMPPEYHLIISEGTDTEPKYFERIKQIINLKYKDKIELDIHGEGDNTLSLLEKAYIRARNNPNRYKHVWVVYDTDDFPADHIDKTALLCKKYSTEDTQYHAIWSNQCIELWFLLHFSFMHSDIHRTGYFSKLTEHLSQMSKGDYTKNRDDVFDILAPYMEDAIRNAKKLNKINGKKLPSKAAPGTKVYELVEKLKPYLG
jgi:hypothetical protein